MIASFIDGRVRLRAAALKDHAKMSMVESMIKGRDGVFNTVPNLRTGSLLVEYDPNKIPRSALLMAAQALEAQLGLTEDKKDRRRGKDQCCLGKLINPKSELLLLAASMAATVVGGAVSKKLHLAAGVLFVLMAVDHMYDRRKSF